MAKSSREIAHEYVKNLTEGQINDLLSWLRPLQQALSVEVEHGFINLLGRDETFHSFMARKLISPPHIKHNKSILCRLEELANEYQKYPTNTDSSKRRLVTTTRQYLFGLNQQYQPTVKAKTKHLNFLNTNSNDAKRLSNFNSLKFSTPLAELKGIGPKIAEKLSTLGLLSVKDLLHYFPRDYVDYTSLLSINELRAGEAATFLATVKRCYVYKSRRNPNLSILELNLKDKTGSIKISRFYAGRRYGSQSYLQTQARLYPPGSIIAVSGLVKSGPYGKTVKDPVFEVLESKQSPVKSKSIGRVLPIYSLTEGLSADRFRELVDVVLPMASKWPDAFDRSRLDELSLPTKSDAILAIHKPFDQASLKAARRRLVFDEFFLLQLGLLRRRSELKKRSSPPLNISRERDGLVGRFLEMLPFPLTGAQQRVLAEIEVDLARSEPMSRLVQGDVGSGKTVVAIAALLNAVQSGWQGALMAPTEVLANQHYRTLCGLLTQLHVNVELLTGSTSRKQRRDLLDNLANGSLKILVGTHALIEDTVCFSRLGLVVVDEQHRFGVHQRNRLLSKGLQPHLLSMTATPIPRTLALSLHGDLDVSQIDELPPGRNPVKTNLISSTQREKAYHLIREAVLKGQRAYFVLPLVDESEKLDLRSAINVHEQLTKEVFPDFEVGLLHGRMSSLDKKSIINDFVCGKCQVLVSTTVIEVGVDVPEATVMVVDHADRFGLAQLHQLRGRVGRGSEISQCLLINDSKNSLAKNRLEVLVNSNDGFEIAEIDLRLRGPGQVLGTRQSGLPDFALASLIDDSDLLELAREEASHTISSDPELIINKRLKKILDEHWQNLANKSNLN